MLVSLVASPQLPKAETTINKLCSMGGVGRGVGEPVSKTQSYLFQSWKVRRWCLIFDLINMLIINSYCQQSVKP